MRLLNGTLVLFQDLAKKAPESNYLRYNFGNAYSQFGAVHTVLASNPRMVGSERLSHWQDARSWYRRSLEVWVDLKRLGQLSGGEITEPERIPKEILRCDEAIARLQRSEMSPK